MRTALLCLLLALPAAAADPSLLLRTPPWELRSGDAAAALEPVLTRIRQADAAALDAWIVEPVGENPLGPALLEDAAAGLRLDAFAHTDDPLGDRPDPELEALRTLGRLLTADGRRLGREGGWDAAAGPLRSATRLAEHLGEAPGLTRVLVGVATQQRVVQALEALAGEPGVPNLHGTLADLDRQRIDVLPAAWTQMARPALNDPLAQEARDAVDDPDALDDAAWDALLHRLVLGLWTGVEPDAAEPLPPLPGAAKAALAGLGPLLRTLAPPGTEPASRATIEGALAEWDRLRGVAWSDTLVPYAELRRRGPAEPGSALGGSLLPFVSTPLPALAAAADLDRRLAALRGAEALRRHAVREGRFPLLLSACRPPVPNDPFTGEPPAYEASSLGSSATLTQARLPGDAPGRSHTHRLGLR